MANSDDTISGLSTESLTYAILGESSLCSICQIALGTVPKLRGNTKINNSEEYHGLDEGDYCRLCILLHSISSSTGKLAAFKSYKAEYFNLGGNEAVSSLYSREKKNGIHMLSVRYRSDGGRDSGYSVRLLRAAEMVGRLDQRSQAAFTFLAPSTGSEQSLSLVRTWLQECNETHKACQQTAKNFLPTRLIDIGTSNPIRPRVCLGTNLPLGATYLTLSHCWGESVPIKLLQSNILSMLGQIMFEELSKTFKEAMIATQYLGHRYLWIDSLCIIQDSLEDWHKESALMSQIYLNGQCNLSATAAKDGKGGLFFDRDPLVVQLIRARVEDEFHYIYSPEAWEREITKAPLNSRAWVFQERLLSPSNLHFGATQMFWECRQSTACETFPNGIPTPDQTKSYVAPLLANGIATNSQLPSPKDRILIWDTIMRLYMNATLTFWSDRLIAVGGLAKVSQPIIGGQYMAGLWLDFLPQQLLWSGRNRVTPSSYLAPSWSWASANGGTYDPTSTETTDDVIQVLDAHIDPVSEDRFGQVKGGYIVIKGELAEVEFWTVGFGSGFLVIKTPQPDENDVDEYFSLWWDIGGSDRSKEVWPNGSSLFILPVRTGPFEPNDADAAIPDAKLISGLILEPSVNDDRPWEFNRVGKFTAGLPELAQRVWDGCRQFRRKFQHLVPQGNRDEELLTITII